MAKRHVHTINTIKTISCEGTRTAVGKGCHNYKAGMVKNTIVHTSASTSACNGTHMGMRTSAGTRTLTADTSASSDAIVRTGDGTRSRVTRARVLVRRARLLMIKATMRPRRTR